VRHRNNHVFNIKIFILGLFLSFFSPYQINNNCTTQLLPICIPLGPIYITSQLWDALLHRVIPSTSTRRDANRRSVWSHWGPHGSPNTDCCCLATTLETLHWKWLLFSCLPRTCLFVVLVAVLSLFCIIIFLFINLILSN